MNAVAWSIDGKIASGSTDITVMIWNSSTGERLKTLDGHRLLQFGNVASSALARLAGERRRAFTGKLTFIINI